MSRLLRALVPEAERTPVFLKLAPDLEDEALAEAVEVAVESGCAGVIATNTTLSRPGDTGESGQYGGLSGAPLRPLARARIVTVLAAAAGRVPVIGGGGVKEKDFDDFDLILAMDWDNLSALQQVAPKRTHHKLQLLMRFATEHETATIPDPYYGNAQGFEQVLDYIEDACTGLLELAKRRATQVAAA